MSQPNLSTVEDLLDRAAEVAVRDGVPGEAFMAAAWRACLAANPALREEFFDKELRAQLKKLRRQGLVGEA